MKDIGRTTNRWFIAAMGTGLQLCLGTVYAWSFFQKPLVEAYKWSNSQVAWAFSLAILFLGLAAAWGGVQLPKLGPRKLALTGAVFFGSGYLIAALALHLKLLWLLLAGYGVIGGIGLGLGYVTPVATIAKWFPDKKGLATGLVVMGFGFGALLMSKVIAPFLMKAADRNLVVVFAVIGVLMMVFAVLFASQIRNPPAPASAGAAGTSSKPAADNDLRTSACIGSGRFAAMWAFFFCNTTAGIAIISFQSPLMQDLLQKTDAALAKSALEAAGATLIAVSSIFNGVGRFLWATVSDRFGRAQTFRTMLLSQAIVLVALIYVGNPWVFGALICYVLLCYGGGFGTMPSFVLDVFGGRRMPVVYGTILTAWSAAGIVGPQLVAMLKDRYAADASHYAFMAGAGFLIVGFVLAMLSSNRPLVRK